MNSNLEKNQGGSGRSYFCVEDDPYGGILRDQKLWRNLSTESLDDFLLRGRNR